MRRLSRRRFLEVGAAASFLALLSEKPSTAQSTPGSGSIVIARNGTPSELVSGAVKSLGGMDTFVGAGDVVLLKPNASFSVPAGTGANTSPGIASTVARLAFEAGASKVIMADHTINKPGALTVQINGLREAAEGCGAEFLVLQQESDFETMDLDQARTLRKVDVAKAYTESDVLINLPVLKHHDATGSSVGLKGLMGLVYDRTVFHRDGLDATIADLSLGIRPNLTIVDATKTLVTNGPRGPGELVDIGKVVAGVDPVAVDVASMALAYSLGYADFGIDDRNAYVRIAGELGVGESDPSSVLAKTFEVDVKEEVSPSEPSTKKAGMPAWMPYASLSVASVALGLAAMIYDRRKTRDAG